jgi:hypothetical protein
MQERRPWRVEAYTPRGGGRDGWHWHDVWHLAPERDLSAAIRSMLRVGQSGCWRIRNGETDDILMFDQAQAISTLHLPLVPEVLEAFFTANRRALYTGAESEPLTGNPE